MSDFHTCLFLDQFPKNRQEKYPLTMYGNDKSW